MIEVGVYEAKTRLPKLLEQVARGYRITITKHGAPVAMLVPARRERGRPVEETIRELLAFRNLHPFAERSEPRGFPKQPSVRCKSKGQNPELWPAGPALLLALWRPAGP